MHEARTALLTGRPSGIGNANVSRLPADGLKAWAAHLNMSGAEQVATELGEGAPTRSVGCGVTDRESVKTLAEAVFAEGGRMDVTLCQGGRLLDIASLGRLRHEPPVTAKSAVLTIQEL